MQLDWHDTLSGAVPEGDDLPLYPEDYRDLYEDPGEMRSVLINLESRHADAVNEYMTRTGRLAGLRFMSPGEQGKHFEPWTRKDDVVARTANRPSLFFEDYGSNVLRRAFWAWFAVFFDAFTTELEYDQLIIPECEEYEGPRGVLWRRFLKDHHLLSRAE